jgi:hypothetical protein
VPQLLLLQLRLPRQGCGDSSRQVLVVRRMQEATAASEPEKQRLLENAADWPNKPETT